MSSGRNTIPALGGFNPDYYAETASIVPGSPASRPSRPSRPPQPQYPSAPAQQQQLPPRPHSGQGTYQQQTYAPPQSSGYGPSLAPPPQYYTQPPPGGSQSHDVPPPKPPRPVSWSGPGSPSNGSSSSNTPSSSKPTLSERLHQWGMKAGEPINKITNKLGSEAFWPSKMDLECDKAARILQSFCKDGFYAPDSTPNRPTKSPTSPIPRPSSGPKSKPTVLVKIPQKVIQSAAGLAIFTTFRTGLHISGAGGSGIVVSRLPNGTWSPPSGFLVHTLGAGFMVGLDIYDCVCVLRTSEAVRAFTRSGRLSLGGEIGLVAGPVGAGTSVETAIGGKNDKPVWSYMKSRGLYAGVQADGTVIIARPDANAAFYGVKKITPEQILNGQVPARRPSAGMWPEGARKLMEVLKAAEGRRDVDEGVMRDVGRGWPTPGDLGVRDDEREVELAPPGYEKRRQRDRRS
ncbi:putative SH3 domain-containing YSC84-like protein 1 [Apodospora peruviana]|uniref:SH3 domain-containing YSC84-like protein 1 n=1 Tax=Apodospora peruviana TaxID=516989 RepID=A0AAE0MC05_9PEZI|nr:putative SH3 domain-containing YSC84-like protein 1 [Apodospora peruviana]